MTQREQDLRVLRENVSLLDRRIFRETQKRLPFLAELAALTLDRPEGKEHEPPLSLMRRTVHEGALQDKQGVKEGVSAAKRTVQQTLSALDRTVYVNACLSLLKNSKDKPTLSDFFPTVQLETARIAYVKNPYTDEAYESFAATLPTPTVHYADSFREACNEVASKEADFCILPYGNSAGQLTSFSELAERHSLYICALCRVFHADGTDVTHFALYGHRLPMQSDEDGLHLRFSFLCADAGVLAQHLNAAVLMGVPLEETRAIPCVANEGALLCTATAAPPSDQLLPFLVYLSVFAEEASFHGLYKEI